MRTKAAFFIWCWTICCSLSCWAGIRPENVAVVVNSNMPMSAAVGTYYCQQRGIPPQNLIAVDVASQGQDTISQAAYADLAQKIRDCLTASPLNVDPDDWASDPIQVLVMCYGIPHRIWGDQSSLTTEPTSVDSYLTLLFNPYAGPDVIDGDYWDGYPYGVSNPYSGRDQDFAGFRASTANSISGFGHTYKMRYLVCRLDAYDDFTVDVPGFGYMPRDVRDMIDRAANSAGQAGKFILDEPWWSDAGYGHYNYSLAETRLDALIGSANVLRDGSASATYLNQSDAVGYASFGMHDIDIMLNTDWARPHFDWKPGAVALVNESRGGERLRVPWHVYAYNSFSPSQQGYDSANPRALSIEEPVLRIKADYTAGGTTKHFEGYRLALRNYAGGDAKSVAVGANGIAEIDLTDQSIQWPDDHRTYIQMYYPNDDGGYHDGQELYSTKLEFSPNDLLWSEKNQGRGRYAEVYFARQSSTEYIRDGCSGVNAAVYEPGINFVSANVTLPRYAKGYTWAEAAYMGAGYLGFKAVLLGDPLMAPYSTPPSVSITEPSATFVSGTIGLAATAESAPNPATGIAKVDFWLQGSTAVLLGTATTSPYTCSLDTTQYSDGTYALAAVAYEDNSQHECAQATKNIVIYNNHQVADARALQTSTLVTIQSIPVIAGNTDAMDGAFYIEEPDRTTGIRVAWTTNSVSADQTVTVTGTIGNNSTTGEREITASSVTTGIAIGALQPVAIGNLNIGGSAPGSESYTNAIMGGVGLYNTGLLVRVWGVVTYVGDDFIYVDDGSGLQDGNSLDATGLRVCFGSLDKPGIGDYVSVPGVSSIEMIGSNRVRLVRAIDSCAAYSEGEGLRLMSARSVENSESDDGRTGGGTFRPWPYPTAEEVLASVWFNNMYSQPGMLGWALSQPDGSVLDLRGEATCGASDGGRIIGLREWFEPAPSRPNLVLCLDEPIRLDIDLGDMATIDISRGTLVTLSDGRRALMRPEAVYVYTDSRGRLTMPLPWSKFHGTDGIDDEWPWRLKVAP